MRARPIAPHTHTNYPPSPPFFSSYDALFGITHVDFDDPARPRTLKASGRFLSSLFAPHARVNRGGGGGAATAA